jgi:hypothetical protein
VDAKDDRGRGGERERKRRTGRGSDGVKRARADLEASGSEEGRAAAALTKKRPQSGGSADGAGVFRRGKMEVGTVEEVASSAVSANDMTVGRHSPPGARENLTKRPVPALDVDSYLT